ncbi:hypothetical protein GO013_07270 [Pseudodesulfovibrio sp. JC047]|uniref:hypothetical protein n=1 Tax=Pseudodesulfovibrio sp. JC047 TaxID=2683199 RepID=UPI0013D587D9|nr:hypothetical protein [Pseudodesulfovibrio sp. JC047]NDV19218.1 hypothetical protein [Pseudodesulfovibrio sp. JC047]
MPTLTQTIFNAGEHDLAALEWRLDYEPRIRAMRTMQNSRPLIGGPAEKGAGTRFICPLKDETKRAKLIPFEFSLDQAYIIEAGDSSFRFIMNGGQIIRPTGADWTVDSGFGISVSVNHADSIYRCIQGHTASSENEPGTGGAWESFWVLETSAWEASIEYAVSSFVCRNNVMYRSRVAHTSSDDNAPGTGISWEATWEATPIYELASPYSEAQLVDMKRTQSADTLIMTHGDMCQKMLTRSAHSAWSIKDYPFEAGPWEDVNPNDDFKFAVSATTGTNKTLTAKGTGFAPFTEKSVGRFVRLQHTSGTDVTVGWCVITEFVDATHVKVDIKQKFGSTAATEEWNLGAWSEETGYPFNVHWVGPALGFTGTRTQPRRYVQSAADDIFDFSPTNEKGEVLDNSAFTRDLGGEKANAIRWGAWAQYLMFGTNTGEYRIVTPGQEPLTPRNQTPRQDLALGSANVDPVRIGPDVVMVQEQGRTVYSLSYAFETDGLSESELTENAEHLTTSGIVEWAFQRTPRPTLWAVCADGRLISMTYSKKHKVVAWTPRVLGGNYLGGPPIVESIACIPGDGLDDVYLIVRRTIQGQTRRYIECMEAEYEEGDLQEDCFYVDCGLTYAGPAVQTVCGLEHLEGETVDILADGSVHPRQIVHNGTVSLQLPACKVHVGLNYRAIWSPMRVELQSEQGSTAGKDRRNDWAIIYMWGSLGLKCGPSLDEEDLQPVVFRTTSDRMDQAPDLFTGVKRVEIKGTYNPFADLYLVHDQPLPFRLQRLDRHFEFKD